MSEPATERFRPRMRRRWWPIPLFLLALLAFLGWTAWETRTAMSAVDAATARVNDATTALGEGDIPKSVDAIRAAGDETSRAADAADSVPMRVLGSVPWAGRDVRAARLTVHSVDGAVNDSVLPLLRAVEAIKTAQDDAPPGAIAVAALTEQTPAIEKAAKAAATANEPLARVDPHSLMFLDSQVGDAQAKVAQLADMTQQAASVAKLAPYLLGTDEPRSYLLVFANLSEERPTGGIYGSWALMDVDQGQVSLSATGANDLFEGVEVPWRTQAPADVQALFQEDLNAHQNVNLSPDFPVGADLVSAVWQKATGRPAPDGVIAVTPVALADALAATGPVQVAGGPELTTDNAVSVLQNDVYTTHPDNAARNDYLGQVTGEVFGQVLGTGMASPGLLQHLGAAASSGHILAWFADPQAEQQVAGMPLGGVLPPDPDPDQVRVYLTNMDGSKLGNFTRLTVGATCSADKPELTTSLRYEPDPNAPDYVVGVARRTPRTAHQIALSLYLPPNRGVTAVDLNGRQLPLQVGEEKGWTVARVDFQMDPNTTTDLRWQLDGTTTQPSVFVQPLTNAPTLPDPASVGTDCG